MGSTLIKPLPSSPDHHRHRRSPPLNVRSYVKWRQHRALVVDNIDRFTAAEVDHFFRHERISTKKKDNENEKDPLADLQSSVLDETHFKNLQEIGRGHFGTVSRGLYNDRYPVALKTFHSSTTRGEDNRREYDEDSFNALLREAKIMSSLKHRHLLQMRGITFFGETAQLTLVTDLMIHGSLLDYLRKHRQEFVHSSSSTTIQSRLNQFARQIFQAMIYLEQKFIIHRDLAARNCLIDEHQQLKVADFGLSKLTDCGLYRGNPRTICALRWAAPESIFASKYSSRSDVWSYGVTLWEIYSLGERPFGQLSNGTIRLLLKNVNVNLNEHLRPTTRFQSKEIETYLLNPCWIYNWTVRPRFRDLKQQVEQMLLSTQHPEEATLSSQGRRKDEDILGARDKTRFSGAVDGRD